MQREILFRGKKTSTGEWIEGSLIVNKSGTHTITQVTENPVFDGVLRGWCFGVVPKTVGQFTGLIDKNKSRVFGGDILKFTDEELESFYAEVFWKEYAWMLRFTDTSNEDWLFEYTDLDHLTIEKVGDIYQNPELQNNQKQ